MSVCRRCVCCVRVRCVTRGPCLYDGVGVDSTGGVGEYVCRVVSLERWVCCVPPLSSSLLTAMLGGGEGERERESVCVCECVLCVSLVTAAVVCCLSRHDVIASPAVHRVRRRDTCRYVPCRVAIAVMASHGCSEWYVGCVWCAGVHCPCSRCAAGCDCVLYRVVACTLTHRRCSHVPASRDVK
jgi:hypothetical protein